MGGLSIWFLRETVPSRTPTELPASNNYMTEYVTSDVH